MLWRSGKSSYRGMILKGVVLKMTKKEPCPHYRTDALSQWFSTASLWTSVGPQESTTLMFYEGYRVYNRRVYNLHT